MRIGTRTSHLFAPRNGLAHRTSPDTPLDPPPLSPDPGRVDCGAIQLISDGSADMASFSWFHPWDYAWYATFSGPWGGSRCRATYNALSSLRLYRRIFLCFVCVVRTRKTTGSIRAHDCCRYYIAQPLASQTHLQLVVYGPGSSLPLLWSISQTPLQ